jgi:hypothetical protein
MGSFLKPCLQARAARKGIFRVTWARLRLYFDALQTTLSSSG